MRLRLLFSESFRSLAANVSTTVAATMTVLIGMFLLGLFIALGSWAQDFGQTQKEKLLVKVYFCTPDTCAKEATPAQINAVRRQLESNRLVDEVTFVPKAEALDRMRKQTPELVENLSSNPLARRVRDQGPRRRGRQVDQRFAPATDEAGGSGEDQGRRRGLGSGRERRPRAHARLPRGDDRPPRLLGPPDREHDQALDLLAPPRDRGDEARRRDELVRPRARSCSRA